MPHLAKVLSRLDCRQLKAINFLVSGQIVDFQNT